MRYFVLLALLLATQAAAQQYPAQPVRLIAPAPPGSPVDIRARWVAERLSPALGQPVVVENRAGAGGNLGAEAAAKSRPDGHTLVVVHQGILAVNPHLYARTGFDPLKDFAPITRLVDTVLILGVPSDSSFRSVGDLLRAAKDNPGGLNFGSAGVGTPPHMATELLKRLARREVVHVPYKGAPPALADLLGGRLAFSIDSATLFVPQAKAGKLRLLAVTGRQRLSILPDTPTLAESGLPGYQYGAWIGVLTPAGTSGPVVQRLNAALVKALRSPEGRAWVESQGGVAVGDSPEGFAAYIREEHARWGELIREAGIRAE
jgi:tripartite-type tricarboxylate transporter receptor subunit TctC